MTAPVTEISDNATSLQKNFLQRPYRVYSLLLIGFLVFGFTQASLEEIIHGMREIWFLHPDILVSDYIAVGGLGAAFVNAAITGLFSVLVFVLSKHEPGGLFFGTLGLITGIALFGKNPLNMAPIILGGFLYSAVTKKPFKNCVLYTMLATCLAPAVTQLAYVDHIPTNIGIAVGILVGVFIGFIVIPLCSFLRAAHGGYNLYNVGFGTGILAIGIKVVYQLLGVRFTPIGVWSEGYETILNIIMIATSLYFIVCGLLSKGTGTFMQMAYMKTDNVDYYGQFGGRSYINMGVLGLYCFVLVMAVGGINNGPILGGAISVIGFGGFGKRVLSALPLTIGTMIAAWGAFLATGTAFNSRGFIVAFIFVSCLSPFATKFGWLWGIAAGIVHLSFVASIGVYHGGMNLYNNGLAGGLAMMVLVPLALAVSESKEKKMEKA